MRSRFRPALPALCLALAAALCLPATAQAGWLRRGDRDATATPATWARPLDGGPIRVLWIGPARVAGEAAEFTRRIDATLQRLDADAEPPGDNTRTTKGPFDLVVLGQVNPDALPEALQARVVDLVNHGAGLLLAYLDLPEAPPADRGPLARWLGGLAFTEDTGPLLRGVAQGPGWGDPADAVQAAEPAGRVIWLDYPSDRPAAQLLIPPPADPLDAHPGHTENAWALVARAALWAARRTPPVHIAGFVDQTPSGPDADEIPPDLPGDFIDAVTSGSHIAQPARPFRVVLSAPAPRDYRVRFRVRPQGPASLAETTIAPDDRLAKGAAGYAVELFAGPGDHWLDVWILDGDRVVDWHTASMRLAGWPTLRTLAADKTFLLPNDRLELHASVPPVFSQGRACTVYARALDALGRVVAHRAAALGPEGGDTALALDFADLLSPLVQVEVYAVEGEARPFTELELTAAHRRVLHFPVRLPQPPREPVLLLPEDAITEPANQHRLRDLAATLPVWVASPANLGAVVHSPRAHASLLPRLRPVSDPGAGWPCAPGPVAEAALTRGIEQAILAVWAGGAGAYLFDTPADIADDPACDPATAALLRAAYGDLQTLNTAWQVQAADWLHAAALLHGADATGTGPRLARQALLDRLAQAQLATWRDAARAVDPDGTFGTRVPAAPAPGLDFHIAPAPAAHAARHFGALQLVPGDGTGTYRHQAWTALLAGIPALWWDSPALGPPLAPDRTPAPAFAPLADWFQTVGDGLGALLLAAEPVPAPIAWYGNPASMALRDAVGQVPPLARRVARAGHRVETIGPAHLRAGGLQHAVLILDELPALDDDELRQLRAYVDDGGALLLHGEPGAWNPWGVPRDPGAAAARLGAGSTDRVHVADKLPDAALLAWLQTHVAEHPATPGVDWRRFRYGQAEITAALAPADTGAVHAAAHPANTHNTELVQGRRAGRGDTVAARQAPGEAAVWASQPYRVEGIAATQPERAVAGHRLEFVVQVETDAAAPGDHLFLVDLESRDGAVRRHYRQWTPAPGGVAHGYIPLAINEATGRHRLRVRDLLSGREARFPITLLPNLETP